MDEKQVEEKSPVAEALRAEILKLAKDGDTKKGGALTSEILMRILRVAKTGRSLLMSLDASPKNLANMVKRPRAGFLSSPGGIGDEDLEDDASEGQTYATVSPFATAPPMENFGMTAIREIIAAAKNFNGNGSSPLKLVEALAVAREKGMGDVAKELEVQLGLGKAKPALPAPAPAPVTEPVGVEKGAAS